MLKVKDIIGGVDEREGKMPYPEGGVDETKK